LLKEGEFEGFHEGLYYYQGILIYSSAYYSKYEKAAKGIKIKKQFFDRLFNGFCTFLKEPRFSDFIKKGKKSALNYVCDSLLELERSGAVDLLKKIK